MTQAVQKSEANTIVCNENTTLTVTNQRLTQILTSQLEQQRQLEMQKSRQKGVLKNKRGKRPSVS